ncbi:uncharacterized protein [Palaemon carinicauda]|uniref:uncharacterized protein n=1 Tax=Palaemon carinicauda TaxID=392227 RepID=UPI0035B588D0
MKCLPSAVLTRFETDGYGVQWRDEASFTSVDVDHATEWVNAAAKTSGGLSTITQIDSATLKWMLSFHARSTITTNACDYYNVSQNENDLTPSELKLEARYEDKLVEQMLKYNLFEGRNPDKLTTIINKDVAPPHIEESLLESESKGQEEVKRFMKERLVRAIGQSKPSVLFSAAMKKMKSPTFSNLFEVDQTGSQQNKVVNANRGVLQRLCVAYEAGRPVDLQHIAKHEMMSVPIALFYTDKTMRKGNKSDLVNNICETAKVQPSQIVPQIDPTSSQHVVDGMAYVYRVSTKSISTFGEFATEYCKGVYKFPSTRIDIVMDRYDGTSIKDDTRSASASKSKDKQGKRKQKCKAVPKIISPEVNLPQGDNFKSFLSINDNKIALQQLLGYTLI